MVSRIIIPGKPIPLKRHRHTKTGQTYNSQKCFMNSIAILVKSQWPYEPIITPIFVDFAFLFSRPKSNKKKNLGDYYFYRPDISNLIKMYEDALNGVLWKDDSLIVGITAKKIYGIYDETIIEIKVNK